MSFREMFGLMLADGGAEDALAVMFGGLAVCILPLILAII